MKIRYCAKFALRQMYNRKWSFLFSVLTISIAFFFMDSILTQNISDYYNIVQLKQMIKEDTDSVLQIALENISAETDAMNENISGFIKQVQAEKRVKSSGAYVYTNDMWRELQDTDTYLPLYKTAQENPDYVEGTGILQNLYYIDTEISDLCKLRLTDGRGFWEVDFGVGADAIPVIAGYNFRDIVREGDVYHSAVSEQKYKIVGILEKDSVWLSDDLFYGDNIAVSLDNYFIVPWEYENGSGLPNSIFGILQDSKDFVEVKEHIQEIAAAHGLHVSVLTLDEKIQEFKLEQSQYLKFGIMICLVVMISVFFAVGTNIVTSALLQKNTYGIMLSVGMLYKDIFRMILLENIFRIMLPFFLVTGVRTILIMQASLGDIWYMRHMHAYITPWLFLLALLICFFFSYGTYSMLKKQNPVDLIRG